MELVENDDINTCFKYAKCLKKVIMPFQKQLGKLAFFTICTNP